MRAVINKNPESFWHFAHGVEHSWTATAIVSNAVRDGESSLGFNPFCTKANSCIYTCCTFFSETTIAVNTVLHTRKKRKS